jgi:hypothetical protein
MEVLLSLISLYCSNHFNYKGCRETTQFCIEKYAASNLRVSNFSIYSEKYFNRKERDAVAEGYLHCTRAFQGNDCEYHQTFVE